MDVISVVVMVESMAVYLVAHSAGSWAVPTVLIVVAD